MINHDTFTTDLDNSRAGFVAAFQHESEALAEYNRIAKACKGKSFVVSVKFGRCNDEKIDGYEVIYPYLVSTECTRGGPGLEALDQLFCDLSVECDQLTSGQPRLEFFDQHVQILKKLILINESINLDPEVKAIFGDKLSKKSALMVKGEYVCPECGRKTRTFYFYNKDKKNLQVCEECEKYYNY